MITNNKILLHLNKNPITADIFLTDFCNNKCSYCTYARYGSRDGRYINFDNFKKYIYRMQELGIKGFILTGGGEPTIDPDFDLITGWLENNNIEYGINTNFVEYREIKPIYLKISLDAWNKETYINKRGVDKYDQVINNINKYIVYKENNNVDTQLGIQCLIQNYSDIDNFYDAHKNLKVDYILFRPFESLQGIYYQNKSEELAKIINHIKELACKDSKVKVSYKWNDVQTKFNQCYANYAQLAIDFEGNVLVCCHRPFDIVGHILDDNILEKHNNFKIDMSRCDTPCRLTGPNNCLKDMDFNIKDINFI